MRFVAWNIVVFAAWSAYAVTPSSEEMKRTHEWVESNVGEQAKTPVFSFSVDGKPCATMDWGKSTCTSSKPDKEQVQHIRVYRDSKSGLVVRCAATEYLDYPAVEWVISLKNEGAEDTPILSDIQSIDVTLPGHASLFYSRGSHERADDFEPVEDSLEKPLRLAPLGGRSSDGVLPFFRLSRADGGAMIGIGWTGQWAASFAEAPGDGVRVQAGMEKTHLRLRPGEEIRTPAILLSFWSGGDPLRGNNLLRRLLLKHYTPTPGGKPVNPPVAASPHGSIGFSDTTEANMVQGIGRIAERAFPVDTWWIDAGWNGDHKEWARSVGSWEPNKTRYPNGMKPVAEAAHAKGLRFLLWCEPERVMPNTWLFDNHPEWLLSPANLPKEWQYQENDRFRLLNLANDDALAWVKTTFSAMIRDVGIDIYRQDFNMSPVYFWRNSEDPERQGMTEIRYVTGLYDFYDTLLRDHPNLMIDNCASGGRRIDFEIMRRALTLFRSDLCWEPIAEQSMTYGISFWMPVTGVGGVSVNPYNFRSGMGSHMSLALDFYNNPDIWEPATKMIGQLSEVRHLFTGDYYPLTAYSRDKNQWIAWQYHSPEKGEGIVQAFRRDECAESTINLKLKALNEKTVYVVKNFDAKEPVKVTGRELMDKGLDVLLPDAPGAGLFKYCEEAK